MPVTPPIAPENASDEVKDVYDRIAETIGDGKVPTGYQMMAHSEPFLRDSYMNYRKHIADGTGLLTPKQVEAIVIATSSAMNCVHCVRAHVKEAVAKEKLTEQECAEVLAVTATCAMYNMYHKFKDLAEDSTLADKKIGLRAHTFQKTSLGDELVEIINIVVSNINGCLMCTSGHVKKALKLGLTHDQIDEAVRVSSVMSAFNTYHRIQ